MPFLAFSESKEYTKAISVFKDKYKEYCTEIHENNNGNDGKLLENIIKESFDYIPEISSYSYFNSDVLEDYLELNEDKIFLTGVLFDFNDDMKKYYAYDDCMIGEIKAKEKKMVRIENPELAEIVGEEMLWRAVYFTSELNETGVVPEENRMDLWVATDVHGKPSAYINIEYLPQDVDAHEMMHI